MKMKMIIPLVAAGLMLAVCGSQAQDGWAPVKGHIMTRWAKDVSPTNAHPEYPRPQLVRKQWVNLNGLWNLAITKKDDSQPSSFDKKILVPYPVESALSGVAHIVQPSERIWYKRTFEVPKEWKGKKVMLNFEAVDWDTKVIVNGKEVGSHQGGYDPFSFDITSALTANGPQEIVVSVYDNTSGPQPKGKQVMRPEGIMYRGSSGIWQTVWIEPVNDTHIANFKALPDVDNKCVKVTVNPSAAASDASVTVVALDGKKVVSKVTGKPGQEITVPIKNAKLWSPDSPFLYDLKITMKNGRTVSDEVTGYFGMRKVSMMKDEAGINRLALNNKIMFQYGPLDQGFWPDGLHTAPSVEAIKYDLVMMKKFGCNMVRKHIKVEPRTYYYLCDKLGLVVWQDMPSGDSARVPKIFESEFARMIDNLYNHPSVYMWIVFNEGWGQYDTPRITSWVKKTDPSRLVNNASGWTDNKCGDISDMHNYPGPSMPATEPNRVAVLGEFGGLGRPIKGHTWVEGGNWGYANVADEKSATDAYVDLLTRMLPLISRGLSGAVYTQPTDVEVECNGMMTYDREIVKFDITRAAAAAAELYKPQPTYKTIVPSAEQAAQTWRYSFEKPADNWFAVDFNDSSWKEGKSGFGTRNTPGSKVNTEWTTKDIWIRRTFKLDKVPANPYLTVHHDDDSEVYINGQLAKELPRWTSSYFVFPLGDKASLLKQGENTIAIHCHQNDGAQYIDCGIAEAVPAK